MKVFRKVRNPVVGVTYSAVLNGKRQIVRLEAKLSNQEWVVRTLVGVEWVINPKILESVKPVH